MNKISLPFRSSLSCLALLTALALSATAQQTPAASQAEINQQLMQRIQELEKEVQSLKGQPPPAVVAPPLPAPAPPPEPVVEEAKVNEVAPRLHMLVFADAGAQALNHNPDTFLFGSFDWLLTARLSSKVSALGEVLFIAENDNSLSFDVERLWLRYRQSDYLTASLGRYHTWVGYYNSTYNKETFMETTIDRPFIYAFDDEGGVLPMQEVGLNLTGKIPSGKIGLNYVLELGNGRAWGPNAEPAQNNQDLNNSKSINGGLFIRPEKISGLQLGFSIRRDNLSLPGPPPVAETIATAHAVFVNSKFEILNEAVLVRHVEPTGPVFTTSGGYSQFSRAFGAFRPYFRYQYFNAPTNDPVYSLYSSPNNFEPANASGFVGRVNGPSVGIRYDFTQYSALKFQYDRISERGLPSVNALSTQVAFMF